MREPPPAQGCLERRIGKGRAGGRDPLDPGGLRRSVGTSLPPTAPAHPGGESGEDAGRCPAPDPPGHPWDAGHPGSGGGYGHGGSSAGAAGSGPGASRSRTAAGRAGRAAAVPTTSARARVAGIPRMARRSRGRTAASVLSRFPSRMRRSRRRKGGPDAPAQAVRLQRITPSRSPFSDPPLQAALYRRRLSHRLPYCRAARYSLSTSLSSSLASRPVMAAQSRSAPGRSSAPSAA